MTVPFEGCECKHCEAHRKKNSFNWFQLLRSNIIEIVYTLIVFVIFAGSIFIFMITVWQHHG